MKRFWMFVLLVSLGLNVGLGVRLLRSAGPGPDGVAPGPGEPGDGPRWEGRADADSTSWRRFLDRRLERLAGRLDLTEAQVGAFRATQEELGPTLRRARRELFAARARVRDLVGDGDIDRPAVRALMREIARRQAEMDSLAAESLLRELDVLDADQRRAYLEFLPDQGGRGPGHGGRRGPRRGGGDGAPSERGAGR